MPKGINVTEAVRVKEVPDHVTAIIRFPVSCHLASRNHQHHVFASPLKIRTRFLANLYSVYHSMAIGARFQQGATPGVGVR